jgi:hypothetical protein
LYQSNSNRALNCTPTSSMRVQMQKIAPTGLILPRQMRPPPSPRTLTCRSSRSENSSGNVANGRPSRMGANLPAAHGRACCCCRQTQWGTAAAPDGAADVIWGVFDIVAVQGLAGEPGPGQPQPGLPRPEAMFDCFG